MQKNTNSNSKSLVCVLCDAGKDGQLTPRTKQRILAGKKIGSEMCFVGSNTKSMKSFCSFGTTIIAELNSCGSTVGGVREIKKFLDKNKQYGKVYIVSNKYHLKRIGVLVDYLKPGLDNVKLISAEEVLGIKDEEAFTEILKYLLTLVTIKTGLMKLCFLKG